MPVLKLHVRSKKSRGAATQSAAWPMPKLLMTSAILILMVLMLYTVAQSRWMARQIDNAIDGLWRTTAALGFDVRDVLVQGRQSTDYYQLKQAMGVEQGSPILAFRPAAARDAIKQLPWVDNAEIERRLPHTLIVRLSERQPMARWEMNGKTRVIDMDGKILESAAPESFTSLPLVTGEGADSETKALFVYLAKFPAVAKHVQTARRISDRRWDILLDGRVTAKLPETNMEEALGRLSAALTTDRILERDVVAIDLRQADRLVLESSQAVAPIAKAPSQKTP